MANIWVGQTTLNGEKKGMANNYFERSHVPAGGIISANRLAVNTEIRVVHEARYSAVKHHSVLNIFE